MAAARLPPDARGDGTPSIRVGRRRPLPARRKNAAGIRQFWEYLAYSSRETVQPENAVGNDVRVTELPRQFGHFFISCGDWNFFYADENAAS